MSSKFSFDLEPKMAMVSIAIDIINLDIFEVHNNCSTSNKRTKVGNEIIKLALKVT